ncbi:MAG TPA: glutamyl-tRNA reductase [Candidatus Atribacteria bacterium]|nr:glutamyl-tRNA reductase [Candidatus Atribacteria bacterium]
MNLIVAGLSHKTAPVEIREKLSFSSIEIHKPLKEIVNLPEIYEGFILSTCNRVELVCLVQETKKGMQAIKQFLAMFHKVSLETIVPFLYFYSDQGAISHVFRVASSLDSMVIGEPQILGQLKDAYRCAVEYKATGSILNRFFHKAFSVAKRVRTETNIASSAVSVSFAAVGLAQKIFNNLEDKKILLIGAGEMVELLTRHLVANGVKELLITNRTLENVLPLVKEFGGKAISFDEFINYLYTIDIVITSTASQNFIIFKEQISRILSLRKHRPMFFIDISVPRNIDPQINGLPNVYLYNIDDLEEIVKKNRRFREKEARRAEEIIEEEQARFFTWLQQQEVTPTIIMLKEKFERIRRQELEKTFSHWEGLGEKEKERLNALTQAIVNKFLHNPITYLKTLGKKSTLPLEEIKQIFKLDDGGDD